MIAGIGSYAFRYAILAGREQNNNGMNLDGLIEYCHNKNIKALQICDNIPLHMMSNFELHHASSLCQRYKLIVEIGTTGFQYEHLKTYVSFASIFQAGIVRTVLQASSYKIQKKEILANIRLLIPVLELARVKLAIENHFDLTPMELSELIEEINHPSVKICADPLNSITLLYGINETFKCLGSHIISAHIKDVIISRQGAGFLITGCPLNEGISNIKFYLQNVYNSNPACNVFLEHWLDPMETSNQSIDKEKEWNDKSMEELQNYIDIIETKKN